MEGLNEFFKNPSWISLMGIIAYFTYKLISDYFNNKKAKSDKKNAEKKANEQFEKQEQSYKALDRLSDAVELLIAKETNNVSLMSAETIITAKLNESKATIKDEIRRIFFHNHRENTQRQKIIKQSIANVTRTVFENDIKTLSSLYYKNRRLSDFLVNIDNEQFFSDLVKLLFSMNTPDDDLRDVLYFIDSSFDTFILNGKKYFNNL